MVGWRCATYDTRSHDQFVSSDGLWHCGVWGHVDYFVTLVWQGHPENILAGLSVIEQGREVEPVCTVQPVLLNVALA